jgi:hypothetical protein
MVSIGRAAKAERNVTGAAVRLTLDEGLRIVRPLECGG